MLFRSLDGAGASSDRSQTAKKRWQDLELGQSRMSNRAALDGNPSIGGPAYRDRRKDFPLWPNTHFVVWPHGWLLCILATSVDV